MQKRPYETGWLFLMSQPEDLPGGGFANCPWGLAGAARKKLSSETLSAISCRRRDLGRAVSNQYKYCPFVRIFSYNAIAQ